MVSLYFMHYNVGRVHQTVRVTPAMEAGLTDHVWPIEEIVGLLDNSVDPLRDSPISSGTWASLGLNYHCLDAFTACSASSHFVSIATSSRSAPSTVRLHPPKSCPPFGQACGLLGSGLTPCGRGYVNAGVNQAAELVDDFALFPNRVAESLHVALAQALEAVPMDRLETLMERAHDINNVRLVHACSVA